MKPQEIIKWSDNQGWPADWLCMKNIISSWIIHWCFCILTWYSDSVINLYIIYPQKISKFMRNIYSFGWKQPFAMFINWSHSRCKLQPIHPSIVQLIQSYNSLTWPCQYHHQSSRTIFQFWTNSTFKSLKALSHRGAHSRAVAVVWLAASTCLPIWLHSSSIWINFLLGLIFCQLYILTSTKCAKCKMLSANKNIIYSYGIFRLS